MYSFAFFDFTQPVATWLVSEGRRKAVHLPVTEDKFKVMESDPRLLLGVFASGIPDKSRST